ncbi:MAG: SpoIIE family protein phosphatase, partial [Ardenticatenia bacterium]|nr:SpoIIE family protein phosphatase [Ardenticatenia bacterium]
MLVDVGVAKTRKYASRESGDTLEMVERPHGGISFVLADGQRSGRAAKLISNIAARKAVALLAEGARDGVAARAAHDYLFSVRRGQVRADLQILSVDLQTRTLVISRNTECPALLIDGTTLQWLDAPAHPIGIYRQTKPVIVEYPLKVNLGAIIFTDGLTKAGVRKGTPIDLYAEVQALMLGGKRVTSARALADALLARAIHLEGGLARDDMSVVALLLRPHVERQ